MRRFIGCSFVASLLATGLALSGAQPAAALTVSEQAAALGLVYSGLTQGRNPVFDANGDGLRDLILNGHNQERWWLMLGRPNGTFAKGEGIPFRKYDLHGCTAADFAGPTGGPDGKVDLFCHAGANQGRGDKPYPKQLFVQGASGSFTDVGSARGLGMPNDRGRDALAANIDGDAFPDLVTAALASPTGGSFNRAFVNRNGSFQELPEAKFPGRNLASECMGVLPKANRFDDVFYCAKGGGLAHLRNAGGSFTRVAGAGYLKLPARRIDFADVSGDGRLDLIVLTGGELSVWFNNRADAFPTKDVSIPVQQAWAFAACRIDEDADTDIFVAQGKDPGGSGAQGQDFALLNTGAGKSFTRFAVSGAAEPGNADWVTCLPNWQGSGHALVYVTNGRWLLGGPNRAYVFRR